MERVCLFGPGQDVFRARSWRTYVCGCGALVCCKDRLGFLVLVVAPGNGFSRTARRCCAAAASGSSTVLLSSSACGRSVAPVGLSECDLGGLQLGGSIPALMPRRTSVGTAAALYGGVRREFIGDAVRVVALLWHGEVAGHGALLPGLTTASRRDGGSGHDAFARAEQRAEEGGRKVVGSAQHGGGRTSGVPMPTSALAVPSSSSASLVLAASSPAPFIGRLSRCSSEIFLRPRRYLPASMAGCSSISTEIVNEYSAAVTLVP